MRNLHEVWDVCEAEGVDSACRFTSANDDKPGARDLASYGVVRVRDADRVEPKRVFGATAARYRRG